MSKKAWLDQLQYSFRKTESGSLCSKCGRHIKSKRSYFPKANPEVAICGYCYGREVAQNNKEKTAQAREISPSTEIRVGKLKAHVCNGSNHQLLLEYGKFVETGRNQTLLCPVYICPECGALFIDSKRYEKLKYKLADYSFVNANTGKPYLELKTSEDYVPGFKASIKREIPDSVIWSVKHPYQGGGCSGK